MRIPIRWKLILSIGLPMLAVYGTVLWTEYTAARDRALSDRQARMVEVALRHAAAFNTQFDSAAQAGRTLASMLEADSDLSHDALYALLSDVVRDAPAIYGIGVAFTPPASHPDRRSAPYACRAGADTIRTFDIADSYDYTQARWGWYTQPLLRHESVWTEPYFDEGAGNSLVCTFAIPFQHEGRHGGVVKVDVRLDTLQRRVREMTLVTPTSAEAALQSTSLQDGGGFAIISRNGTFISYPDPDYILKQTIFTLAEAWQRPDLSELAHRMLAGRPGFARIPDWADEGSAWFFYAPIRSTGWSFIAMTPERRFMEPVYAQLQLSGAILTSGLIIVLGILLLSAFRITSPLEKLDRAVEQLAAGDLGVQVEGVKLKDEIGDLARGFNQMVTQLRQSIQRWTDEHAARQAVEHDLRIARHIQKSLLPKPLIDPEERFQLSARNVPARHIGGDFYDYFMLSDTQLMIALGDVSGKGVPAALFMAVTRTLLRELARPGRSPAQILARANEQLLESNAGAMFVTLYLGIYDILTGQLTYASAAHPLAHCLRPDGDAYECGQSTGTVLGILPGQSFEDRQSALNVGDRLVIFTDGFPEARTPEGEFFGDERFLQLLQRNIHVPMEQFCQEIVDVVSAFQHNELRDDMTLLTLQRNA